MTDERLDALAKSWELDAAQFRARTMRPDAPQDAFESCAALCETHAREMIQRLRDLHPEAQEPIGYVLSTDIEALQTSSGVGMLITGPKPWESLLTREKAVAIYRAPVEPKPSEWAVHELVTECERQIGPTVTITKGVAAGLLSRSVEPKGVRIEPLDVGDELT